MYRYRISEVYNNNIGYQIIAIKMNLRFSENYLILKEKPHIISNVMMFDDNYLIVI